MEQVPISQNYAQTFLTPMGNGIDVRERPKTMLSPEMKRIKTLSAISSVVAYPLSIPIPVERVIKSIYKASMEEDYEKNNEKTSFEKKHYNDQQFLTPAGMLSFEHVLLPAIGFEEEKALKQVQSRVQRDAPEYKFLLENCRRLVRESIFCAMQKVQSSRSARHRNQKDRRERRLFEEKQASEIEKRAQKEIEERLARELVLKKERSRSEKRRFLARENPRNQELWKEIVFLTSSVAQLEQEERSWSQIEKNMTLFQDNCENCDDMKSSSHCISLPAEKKQLQIETEEKAKYVILTSTRIAEGLKMIQEVVAKSEALRKKLYNKYKKDHIFHGYQSVHKPKSMVRLLSQSQDDHF